MGKINKIMIIHCITSVITIDNCKSINRKARTSEIDYVMVLFACQAQGLLNHLNYNSLISSIHSIEMIKIITIIDN